MTDMPPTYREARDKARELYEKTGRIHVADLARPSTSVRSEWLLGGWADKTSQWVVVDTVLGSVAWPKGERSFR